MSAGAGLLVVRHVAWEGPHRIAPALADVPQLLVAVLEGEPLPDPATLAGAVVMGGPMSVNDTESHPDLEREKAWIDQALFHELPLLGVGLGSQLIADVLGATVAPAPRPGIGWAPVTITAAKDPVLGPVAPQTSVLHWHAEQFDTPPGAASLARSEQTPCQAFRQGAAWGLHPRSPSSASPPLAPGISSALRGAVGPKPYALPLEEPGGGRPSQAGAWPRVLDLLDRHVSR